MLILKCILGFSKLTDNLSNLVHFIRIIQSLALCLQFNLHFDLLQTQSSTFIQNQLEVLIILNHFELKLFELIESVLKRLQVFFNCRLNLKQFGLNVLDVNAYLLRSNVKRLFEFLFQLYQFVIIKSSGILLLSL